MHKPWYFAVQLTVLKAFLGCVRETRSQRMPDLARHLTWAFRV